jgi:hypothetical protein
MVQDFITFAAANAAHQHTTNLLGGLPYKLTFNKQKMKYLSIPLFILLLFGACQQETVEPVFPRKVEFTLYTNENFANEENVITFHLVMRDGTKTLLDSALTPMKIKDIPDANHKLVFEKTVPGGNRSRLKVGFTYEIENVGNSWYFDECPADQEFKTVEFAFK